MIDLNWTSHLANATFQLESMPAIANATLFELFPPLVESFASIVFYLILFIGFVFIYTILLRYL